MPPVKSALCVGSLWMLAAIGGCQPAGQAGDPGSQLDPVRQAVSSVVEDAAAYRCGVPLDPPTGVEGAEVRGAEDRVDPGAGMQPDRPDVDMGPVAVHHERCERGDPSECELAAGVYAGKERYDLAIADAVSGVKLRQTASPGDDLALADALETLGALHADVGDLSQAADRLHEAISLLQRSGGKQRPERLHLLGVTLTSLGAVELAQGKDSSALAGYNQALAAFRGGGGDDADEAWALAGMSDVDRSMGRYDLAIEHAKKAQELRENGVPVSDPEVATSAQQVGRLYMDLGAYDQALLPLERAARIRLATSPPSAKAAASLVDLGRLYQRRGDLSNAKEAFQHALVIDQDVYGVSDPRTAPILANLASADRDSGMDRLALERYTRALGMEAPTDLDRFAGVRMDYAGLLRRAGQPQLALEQTRSALDAGLASQDTGLRKSVFTGAAAECRSEGRLPEAIFWDKLAITEVQRARGTLSAEDEPLQNGFTALNESRFRDLADWLAATGRIVEAERVIALLRGTQQLRFEEGDGPRPATVPWTPVEAAWRARVLGSKADSTTNLVATDLAPPQSPSNGSVVLYVLVLDDHVRLLVETTGGTFTRTSKVTRSQITDAARSLHGLMEDGVWDKEAATQLYDWLFRPVEGLFPTGTHTVLVNLDGWTQFVPLAALWDDQDGQYAAQKWATEVFTRGVPRSSSAPEKPELAAFGVSDENGFEVVKLGNVTYEARLPKLDAVERELGDVVKDAAVADEGLVQGTVSTSDAFTLGEVQRAVARHVPWVHIATHFVYRGTDAESFLLLGGDDGHGHDNTLTVQRFRREVKLPDVDLLVLSACDTASGRPWEDGSQAQSLVTVALNNGAGAVLGTLWTESDDAAPVWMSAFYRALLTPGVSKAEAVQQVQKAFIAGDIAVPLAGRELGKEPYFWAPFVLYGSGQ